jgi:hypothetical protein
LNFLRLNFENPQTLREETTVNAEAKSNQGNPSAFTTLDERWLDEIYTNLAKANGGVEETANWFITQYEAGNPTLSPDAVAWAKRIKNATEKSQSVVYDEFEVCHGESLTEKDMPDASFLVDELISATGLTFLHGPTSAGKSALIWSIANALNEQQPVFGFTTYAKTRTLFVSLDMNDMALKIRWFGSKQKPKPAANRFYPKFDYITPLVFPILQDGFLESKIAARFQEISAEYGLVIFDALGNMVFEDFNAMVTASKTITTLKHLMGSKPHVLIHHDRKIKYTGKGMPVPATPEDAAGSQMWRNLAVHELHLWKANDQVRNLMVGKSQLIGQWDEPIKLRVDSGGKAELWESSRAEECLTKITSALAGWDGQSKMGAYETIAKAHDIDPKTASRWVDSAGGWDAVNAALKSRPGETKKLVFDMSEVE